MNTISQVVKSPSDSTLYTPALQKIKEHEAANHIIDKISNFVESIRVGSTMSPQSLCTPTKDQQQQPQLTPGTSRSNAMG